MTQPDYVSSELFVSFLRTFCIVNDKHKLEEKYNPKAIVLPVAKSCGNLSGYGKIFA